MSESEALVDGLEHSPASTITTYALLGPTLDCPPSCSTLLQTVLSVSTAISALVGKDFDSMASHPTRRQKRYSVLSEENVPLGHAFLFDIAKLQPERAQIGHRRVHFQIQAELVSLMLAVSCGLQLHRSMLLMSLVLIERMIRCGFKLTVMNVRPVLITALNLCSKEQSDELIFCGDFGLYVPPLHLKHLAKMEWEMLHFLDWNVGPCSPAVFDQYTKALDELLKRQTEALATLCSDHGVVLKEIMATYASAA